MAPTTTIIPARNMTCRFFISPSLLVVALSLVRYTTDNWYFLNSQYSTKRLDRFMIGNMNMTGFPFIMLNDKDRGSPLYRQIYETLRLSILNGEIDCGTQVPSSRLLAKELGVS